ncbi:helix-turn-helix domain-containing protein [Streptomyces sp. NPDC127084]|uniref:helix-turn-helix domain-containing protein n=1 Tax=Streptomyces sp. NPDC127084 TaxID=3347133 RepID=UPI003665A272
MTYQPLPLAAGSSLPPLSRPQLAEARRVRAVELFEGGVLNVEIARAVGVCSESVRRWRRVWEEGGAGSAAGLGDRFGHAAWRAGVVMTVSNSTGVSRPSAACLRRRW